MDKTDKKLTLVEHLNELRWRLIVSLIAIALGAIPGYLFSDEIFSALARPVGKLVFLSPTEALMAKIKLSFFGGLFLALPVVLYQVWAFISSGLHLKEKRYILIYLPSSILLFLAGAGFCYLLVLPLGVKLLLSYGGESLVPMISIRAYLSFVMMLLISFGTIFVLPLAILFLTRIGLIKPGLLTKNRRYAILLIFILAAVITPTVDIVTQLFLAVPLFLLYELSIIISRLATPKKTENS